MADNRGVVYLGEGRVEMREIEAAKLHDPRGRKIERWL